MAVRPVSVVHDEVSEGLKVSTECGTYEDSASFSYRLFFLQSLLVRGNN